MVHSFEPNNKVTTNTTGDYIKKKRKKKDKVYTLRGGCMSNSGYVCVFHDFELLRFICAVQFFVVR